jgi:hypothetical protein
LEIEGCRGKEPLQKNIWLSFSVVAVVAPFSAWGPQTIYLFEGGARGIIRGNRGCRGKRGKIGIP